MSVPAGAAVEGLHARDAVLQVSFPLLPPCGSRGEVGYQFLMNHAAAVDLRVTDHLTFDIDSGILWCVLRGFAGFLNDIFLI